MLGVEGAVGLSDMDWEQGLAVGALSQVIGLELDWFASASLRAGWLVSPETMIYVIGGYSYAEMDLDVEVTNLQGAVIVDDSDKDGFDGFHAGAGIEAMLTDSLTARVEYGYTDYGSGTFTGTTDIDVDAVRTHTGTIGLAWLFN